MLSVRAGSSWTGKVSDSPQTWVVKEEIKAYKHWPSSLEESQTIPVTGTWGHHRRVTSIMVTECKTTGISEENGRGKKKKKKIEEKSWGIIRRGEFLRSKADGEVEDN